MPTKKCHSGYTPPTGLVGPGPPEYQKLSPEDQADIDAFLTEELARIDKDYAEALPQDVLQVKANIAEQEVLQRRIAQEARKRARKKR